MPPDATETKRRILRAAVEEFSRSGLAGARVDRIAETAKANKRSIYVHFGAKEELFDRVVGESLVELAEAIPFDVHRLPAYAAGLFDLLEARPQVLRLTAWAALEREQPIDAEVQAYRVKIEAIDAAQTAGTLRADIPAAELLAMVIAVVTSWRNASWSLRSLHDFTSSGSPDGHRAAIAAAVAGLVRPQPTDETARAAP